MTGRWMDTKEAKHWGLINEIVESKNLLNRAREIANQIANGPNLIYSSIKEVLRETENEKELPSFKILRSLDTVKKVYESVNSATSSGRSLSTSNLTTISLVSPALRS